MKLDAPLHPTEFDFRPLLHKHPSDAERAELRAAIYYEYARESDSIRKLAEEYEALPVEVRNYEPELFQKNPLSSYFKTFTRFWNCIFWPDYFPHTAWLDIPPPERTNRIQSYLEEHPAGFLLQINKRDELKEWEFPKRGRRIYSGGDEILIVEVNWAGGGNDDIINAFAEWVRSSRPKQYPPPRNDASRENVTAALLTRLAVMRLLHRFKHGEALNIAKDVGVRMPNQQSSALIMRQKVRNDIRRIFKCEDFRLATGTPLIPEAELPRAWGTVAEQQRARRQAV